MFYITKSRFSVLLWLAIFIQPLFGANTGIVVSSTPASGVGYTQKFKFSFVHPVSASQFITVSAAVGTNNNPRCSISYNTATTALTLGGVAGSVLPGTAAVLSNGNCSFTASTAVINVGSTTIDVNLDLTFLPAMAGDVTLYMGGVQSDSATFGPTRVGKWTVGDAVTVTPASVTLALSQQQQFSAAVNGQSSQRVTWSLTPAVGTISTSGLYAPPAGLGAAQTVTVTANSVADPTRVGTAAVTLVPPVTVSVAPTAATLTSGETQQFAATVGGAADLSVTWSVSPAVGTVSAGGLYTAPVTITSAQTVVVTATSNADATKATGVAVNLVPPVAVSLAPVIVDLGPSQSQQFTAAVSGAADQTVTWSVNPAIGTVSAGGLYVAPATVTSPQTVTVVARSVADSTKYAGAAINLKPPVAVSLTPATVSLNGGQVQNFSASVTGASDTTVSWGLQPQFGTLTSSGNSATFATPSVVEGSKILQLSAISMSDNTKRASAVLTLLSTVALSVSPASAALFPSNQQQFSATVTGATNTAVTWNLNPAFGTISTDGLYTAPADVPAQQALTVTATCTADPTRTASSTVWVYPDVSVTLSPSTVSLNASDTVQFAATVTGITDKSVTWSLSPAVGTISATGLYTAPASIPSQTTVHVIAASSVLPQKYGTVTVTLNPVSVSVTPATASLTPSQIQQLSATVGGTTNTGITWSLNPAVGTLSTNGRTAVYTSPAIITASQTVEVDATSMADPTKIAKVLITLIPAVMVSVSPSSVTLGAGESQQYSATVSGTSNQAVAWSLNPAVGNISSTGLYTAPATISTEQNVTVTAQSAADTTKSASGTVSLPTTPQIQWSIDANRLTSLSYGGVSFYQYVSSIVQGAVFRAPDGTTKDAGWSNPSKSTLYADQNTFEVVYNLGKPYQFTLRVTWTQTDSRTLRAVAQVTNNDPTNTLVSLGLHILSVTLPGPATQYNQNIPMQVDQYSGNPVSLLSGAWGSLALWQCGYPTPASQVSYYSSPTQTAFANILTTSTAYGPRTNSLETHPGQTNTMTQLIRFGAPTDTAASLAPEAYSEYRTAFPSLVSWPNRNPIAMWMISDLSHASATNPRGYLWDPTIRITDASTFQSRVLTNATNTIGVMNSMSVRPQGIIIWDLEGQEFKQPFTYVGYPSKLPDLAPEMDAVADALMAKIKGAGYRVGVTIRPNHFGTGNSLPPTCVSDPNYSLWDKFILLTASYPNRGYVCSATNTWQVSQTNGPTAQTTTQDYNQALSLLQQKISYAHDRWGATLFYIDSNVWEGGTPIDFSIFRTLAAQFPDSLIIPEIENTSYFGATAPYNGPNDNWNRSAQARVLYPNTFQVLNVSNVASTANQAFLTQAVKAGDILMFQGWWSAPEIPFIQQIYADAAKP